MPRLRPWVVTTSISAPTDRWNKLKKAINASEESERVYFHEGDVWWVHLGVNVGYEIDGKQREFSRPVVALRK